MGTLTYPFTLTAGQPENVNQLNSNLAAIQTVLNGGVDSTNITDGSITATDLDATTVGVPLGLNQSAIRRGKSIIATEESKQGGYGLMATPDRVSNLVLPTDGLIVVAYQASWKENATGGGKAAIFLKTGGVDTQLKVANGGVPPAVQEATGSGSANIYTNLSTFAGGLVGVVTGGGFGGDATTGQVVGVGGSNSGVCHIFAAAGTYDVSVQFLAGSNTVWAKNRKLWVWMIGF